MLCDGHTGTEPIKLNTDALAFAQQLIADGRVAADKSGHWSEHKPSPDAENAFIEKFGYAEYAKWHLAIDDSHAANSKARYKFPFGDFTHVHRCGVIAAKNRAHQFGYTQISDAATQLERAIDEAQSNPPTPTKTRR